MSTATLPVTAKSARTSTTETKSMVCAECFSVMTVTPNPYFGTGLAVHRHIAMCDGCDAVVFVPEPEAVPSMVEQLITYVRDFFAGTTHK